MQNAAEIITVTGRGIPLPGNDIDTDRIIPARFLRCVTFDALGEQLFRDERYDENDTPLDHPLNDPRFQGGSILVVNANFGCGSSREHAPQSIMRFGVSAIVGESFAEIFAGNCTNLGIPVFTAAPEVIQRIMQKVESQPETELTLNLTTASLSMDGESISLVITDSSKDALTSGTWDSLGGLLKNSDLIEEKYEQLPYIREFQ